MKRLALLIITSLWIYSSAHSQGLRVNGKSVEIKISGMEHNQPNKPVIVFENGRGTTFDYWEKVISEVSQESVVFAYNRPRIGKSEDDSIPPTMKHIVGAMIIGIGEIKYIVNDKLENACI